MSPSYKVRKVRMAVADLPPISGVAKQMVESEDMKPYMNVYSATFKNDSERLEAALAVVCDLSPEKRYTKRIFWALEWALGDFDSETVKMDLPHIPEAELADLVEELNARAMQLEILRQTLLGGTSLEELLEEKSKQRK